MIEGVSADFWDHLRQLVASSQVAIDRPRGSGHPDYPDVIYPHDYGYLAGTTAPDGGGVDVWVGSGDATNVTGVICTVDLLRRDTEIKILLGCTAGEMETIFRFHDTDSVGCMLIPRERD